MNLSLWMGDREYRLQLQEGVDRRIQVRLNGQDYRLSVDHINGDEILIRLNGRIYHAVVSPNAGGVSVFLNGRSFELEKKSTARILGETAAGAGKRDVKTAMPGRIVKVLVEEGEEILEGQAVLILEAMKMQNEIKSPRNGTVTRIGPRPGVRVEAGALLFTVE